MESPTDITRFGAAAFSAKAWINASLREVEGGSSPPEPLDVRLSVLLTKLQLQAADIDAAMQETSMNLISVAPTVAADVSSAQEQARSARNELSALLEQAAAIEASSAAAVHTIREVVSFQESVSAASSMLGQADQVSRALGAAERSFARGDTSAAASSLCEARLKLAAPGGLASRLLPDALVRAEALAARLEEGLRPALLEAIRGQQAEAMVHHATTLQQLGQASTVRECYVDCAQGPLFEQWNAATRAFGGPPSERAQRAAATCTGVGDFLVALGEAARTECAWLSRAMPRSEANALVAPMLRNALATLQQPMEQALLACLPHPSSKADAAGGEALLQALERAWASALAAAEAAGAELSFTTQTDGQHSAGLLHSAGFAGSTSADVSAGQVAEAAEAVAALQQAFLAPFATVQQRAASALAPLLLLASDNVPNPSTPQSHRQALEHLRRLGSAVDTGTPPLLEAMHATARRLLPFCGALGAEGLCAWQDARLTQYIKSLRTALDSVAAFDSSADPRRASTPAASASTSASSIASASASGFSASASAASGDAAADDDDDEDSDEGEEGLWEAADASKALARQALGLLRVLQGLRRRLVEWRDAVDGRYISIC